MKSRSLLTQVLIVNLVLVAATALVAAIAVHANLAAEPSQGREGLVLGLALVATMLGNWLLLRRRFKPLDQLICAMEHDRPRRPRKRARRAPRADSSRGAAPRAARSTG